MKEIKEAVKRKRIFMIDAIYENPQVKEDEELILDLAEKVLAVGIGLCLEDTKTIVKRYFDKCGGVINYNEIAKQLHSAQMEKLGG